MNKATMRRMRADLETRRDGIARDLNQMAGELQDIGIDQGSEGGTLGNHLADDGSNVMEAERLTTISGDVRSVLDQIEAALRRMDDGNYGTCQRCGKQINRDRLEAFPYVAYCIECQALLERQQALLAGR